MLLNLSQQDMQHDAHETLIQHEVNVATTTILVNLKVFVEPVLPWALNDDIYIYIIMKYAALILLNYEYIP